MQRETNLPDSGHAALELACANLSDVEDMVAIHREAFQGFFLESLGPAFLRELYRGFIESPLGICIVARANGEAIGFVVGTVQDRGFFRALLVRRWHAFLLAGVPALLRRPLEVGKKFFHALLYRGDSPAEIPGAALLSSIAVCPGRGGKGAGRALLDRFCSIVGERGSSNVVLTTDRDGNEAVNRFYLQNGFQVHSTFLKEKGRWMNLFARPVAACAQKPHGEDSGSKGQPPPVEVAR